MTDKKTVLLAESSRILTGMLKKTLEEEEFNVILCEDGFEALKMILSEKPDCVLADKSIPKIDGIQLCSLIKKGYDQDDIPFIIFSAEKEESDFWIKNSYADDFVYLSAENIEEVIESVRKTFVENKVCTSAFTGNEIKQYEENEIAMCSVRALEKVDFYSKLKTRVIALSHYIDDVDRLVEQLFMLIYEISSFDSAIIILNDQTSLLYSTGLGNLSKEAEEQFVEICKTDYEELLNGSNSVKYETFDLEGITPFFEAEKKLSSYQMFPIGEEEIIGTIHLASERKKIFTYKIQSAIQMITRSICHIIQKAVWCKNISAKEAKLRTAFSKFVPEEIIDGLILKNQETDDVANNEKRKVAVLICDIRNFTTISELNQPEAVVGFLNNYFSLMVDIIKKHGGAIDKFIGDAIMALFGAPISYVDNAKRAVDAALEMVNSLEKVNTTVLNFPEGMPFDIGIGIHYGEVIVGNIGSKEKTDYTVIGDSVNLTSRLEGLTKQYGTKIIISQAAKEDLSEFHHVMQIDKVRVKGKTQGVEVYRVDEKALPEEYIENYEKGLNLYMTGAWVLAISYFEKALQVFPGDKATKLMIKRCEDFMENPPDDWDGAIVLTSK